jgi:hypothetical protein
VAGDLSTSGQQAVPLSETDIRQSYTDAGRVIAASNGSAVSGLDGQQWQFYSADGGHTWGPPTHLPLAQSDTTHTDPAVDWTSDGTAWAITIGLASDGNRIRSYTSGDGGKTWTLEATPSGTQTNVDRCMMWVDHAAGSPHRDNVYVIWQIPGTAAFVARRTGGAWQAPLKVSGAETTGSPVGADIKTNGAGDVFAFWPDTGSGKLFVAKSIDGGGSFSAPAAIPAKGPGNTTFGRFQFAVPAAADRPPGIYLSCGAYRDATRNVVHAVWADLSGQAGCTSGSGPGTSVASLCTSRIWYSRSTTGGTSWDAAIILNNRASLSDQFHPHLAVDENTGDVMVAYYDTANDAGRHKTDVWMQTSSDDGVTWRPPVRLTSAQTDETIAGADNASSSFLHDQYGDYIGLSGNAGRFFPSWVDRRSGAHEEIWTIPIMMPTCSLIVDKSTFGQDEVEVGLPGTSSFAHAYWVAVDGYTAGELGFLQPSDLNSANPTPAPTVTATIDPALNPSLSAAQLTAITGMFVAPGGVALFAPPVVAEDPTLQQTFQRFLYPFTIAFNGDAGFVALLTNQTALVTLHASITAGNITRTASAVIELTKGEDPYFQDVNVNTPTQPSWLSFDLRFLKVKGNESRFGAPAMSTNAADAPTFISNVLGQLNTPGANLAGDSFEGLTQNEDASALEFLQKDSGGNFTFNFALARVRMIGKTAGATAKAVRVFFRLFQAQTTGSDFNDQTTYRFASDGITYGHKIARLGVQNDQNGQPEYVTVPCFATPRINLAGPASMDGQLDQPNVRDITVQTSGVEVDTYFGCWLDINQPQQTFLPLSPPAGNWDGAWTGALHSLNEVITRSPHQCLIAEIRFDDTPVPLGATSWDSDKIAQRNIAWIDGPNPGVDASRRMPHPFELRPSPTATETPDELMILWGRTPAGSTGSFYLPEVSAAEILKLADSMYAAHQLTASDANTITVPAAGLTFIPLPSGTARSAGLLTVDLAGGLKRGQVFEIVVRQLTEAAANVQPNPPPPTILARRARATVAPREGDRFTWRQLKGAFQLTITVKTKEQLLYPEERLLAWLRWIALSMPPQHRWYPVFHRYLEQIAGRVLGFGGDPTQIRPSPTGDVTPIPLPPPPKQPPSEEELAFTGKVSGLIFDHFGDFEGFLLDTEDGERRFSSREKDVETLAERAWRERLRITIRTERHARQQPTSIVVLEPPVAFGP